MKLLPDFTHLKVPISTSIPILYNLISITIFWCVSLPFADERKKSLKTSYSQTELPFCFQCIQRPVRGNIPCILQKQRVLKGHLWLKVGTRETMWNIEAVSVNQCTSLISPCKLWLGWATDKGKTCPGYSSTKRSFSLFISPCHCCF